MTRIQFRQVGNHFMATFEGHAGAKRVRNHDLVCAAVSMLAQSLIQACCDALERGDLARINTIKKNKQDGAVSLDVLATDEGFPKVLGAFSTIAAGCSLLHEKYPENVSLGRNFQTYSLQ